MPTTPLDISERPIADANLDLRGVMAEMHRTFVRLLAAVPGSPTRLIDVAQVLGLRQTLAWRIAQFCGTRDPLQAAEFLPGSEGTEIFLKSALKAGASAELVQAARAASERFRAMVGNEARTEGELKRLLMNLAPKGNERLSLRLRRQAVEANSGIWGVHAEIQYRLGIVFDGGLGPVGTVDLAPVRGYFGFSRLREGVSWEFGRGVNLQARADGTYEPLVPRPMAPELVGSGEMPVLGALCRPSVPAMRRTALRDGSILDEILPGPVGLRGAADVLVGEVVPGLFRPDNAGKSENFMFGTRLRTPTDMALLELHMQRSLYPGARPDAVLLDLLQTTLAYPNTLDMEPARLPVDVEVQSRGPADVAPPLISAPRHAEVVAYVYQTLGLRARDFDVYTVELSHPPIPSHLTIRLPAPFPGRSVRG